MHVSYPYLDKTGLTNLWGKIKSKFVAKDGDKVLSDNNFNDDLYTKLTNMDSVSFNDDATTFLKGDGSWGTPSVSVDDMPKADYGTYGVVKYASDENIRSYFNVGYSRDDVVVSEPITLSSTNTSAYTVDNSDCRMVNGWVFLKPKIRIVRTTTFGDTSLVPICTIPSKYRAMVSGETGSRLQNLMSRIKVNNVLYPESYATLDTTYNSQTEEDIYVNANPRDIRVTQGDLVEFEYCIAYPWGGSYAPPNLTNPVSVIDGTESIQLRQYSLLNSMDVSNINKCTYTIPETLIGNFYNFTNSDIPYSGTNLMKFYEEHNKGFYIESGGALICPKAGTLNISFGCQENGTNGYTTAVSIYINNEVMDFFTTNTGAINVNVSYEILAGDAIYIVQTEGYDSVWWGVYLSITNLSITLE